VITGEVAITKGENSFSLSDACIAMQAKMAVVEKFFLPLDQRSMSGNAWASTDCVAMTMRAVAGVVMDSSYNKIAVVQ
jgi:hypothetical protein